MNVGNLRLPGLRLIQLDVFQDSRGFFVERFNWDGFQEKGLPTRYVQDNHSRSLPGVLRGLHYQHDPGQGKLIGVVRGMIWNAVVDLRIGSPTFGEFESIELSDMNGLALWVPAGFATGYCVPGDEPADVIYKADSSYRPDKEGGIHWADPDLHIPWPLDHPIVNVHDAQLPSFQQYVANPVESFSF